MNTIPFTSQQENPSLGFTFAPTSWISTIFFLSKAFSYLTIVLALSLSTSQKFVKCVNDLISLKTRVYIGFI